MNDGMNDEAVVDTDTGVHTGTGRFTSMSTLKRWIALAAGVVIALAVLAVIGALSLAVRQSGDGADPDEAFSATELVPESLGATVTWSDDAADLVRIVEPTTRDEVAAAWLRANDALMRAAEGDLGGLDVWFTGPALDGARERFDPSGDGASASRATTVRSSIAIAHDLRVEFYSLDGQIVVLRSASDVPVAEAEGEGDTPSWSTVRSEVILVLSDGNWRIRNIERLTDER
jgi:hypothetical protein